jgi:hypothetical protein
VVFGSFESDRAKKARQREEALEAVLLAEGKTDSSEKAKKAIAYWQLCRSDYERLSKQNETRWLLFQGAVVFFSVVATIFGVIIPDSLAWIRSIPAAIVTIAAGFLSSFAYRENAIRYEVVATDLWNQLAQFRTGAAPYDKDEDKNTSAFVNAVCRLVGDEVRKWSVLVKDGRAGVPSPQEPEATHSSPSAPPPHAPDQ